MYLPSICCADPSALTFSVTSYRTSLEQYPVYGELVHQCGLWVFDQADQLFCCHSSDLPGILTECGKFRFHHSYQIDSVISGNGYVFWNPKAPFPDLIHATHGCIIIRVHDTGRRIWKIQQFAGCFCGHLQIAVRRSPDISSGISSPYLCVVR